MFRTDVELNANWYWQIYV